MGITFEPVKQAHLPALRDIYNYYVRNSTATFHGEPRTVEDMAEMLLKVDPAFLSEAWVVFSEGELSGYVYFAPYKSREAYRFSSEVTLYLAPHCCGKGIGRVALGMMEKRAEAAGVHTLMAVICGENEASICLFEKCGYEKCAHLREVGRKFDRVLDVVMYQKLFR